jgi:L-arabinose isomerase
MGDGLRIVANDVELVPPDEPLPALPVARAVWTPAPDLATSAEAWLHAGGPHHTVLTTAVPREVLDDFVTIAGIELLHVDADTTMRSFLKELRWSATARRLGVPF